MQASRPKSPSQPPTEADDHRGRLIAGMIEAITEKGYAATTIGDIVRLAHVSKRTFYECFEDKQACMVAAYGAVSDLLVFAVTGAANDEEGPLEEQLDRAVQAYLTALQWQPSLVRILVLEIQGAGIDGLKVRRRVNQAFADQLIALVDRARKTKPSIRALDPTMAMALVGGINELLLHAVEDDRLNDLGELGATAMQLFRAVITPK